MEAVLSQPRGFCAGVVRAIEIVEIALRRFGRPVHVLHEIVHNRHVVERLEKLGAVFVETLEEIPRGAVIVLSAHGVGRDVEQRAHRLGSLVIDATCPLVRKVHSQLRRYESQGLEVLLVGHVGHPEVEGTQGQSERGVRVIGSAEDVRRLRVEDPSRVAYVTQTTLSVDDTKEIIDALRLRFPDIRGPELDDICYATQNRQNAVKNLAGKIDVLLVVGARNSSNSNRLREVGERLQVDSYLVEDAGDLDTGWFRPGSRIGITAGASAPESLVRGVLDRLGEMGKLTVVESSATPERTVFPMPAELADSPAFDCEASES